MDNNNYNYNNNTNNRHLEGAPVLQQLFDGVGGTLDDFSRGDAVDHSLVEPAYNTRHHGACLKKTFIKLLIYINYINVKAARRGAAGRVTLLVSHTHTRAQEGGTKTSGRSGLGLLLTTHWLVSGSGGVGVAGKQPMGLL